MVEDVQKLGKLLELPNLDDETIKLINAKMRELIGSAKVQPPVNKELSATVIDEWLNGGKEGE